MRTTFYSFIEYCLCQRNLSGATCDAYTSDFNQFRDWMLTRKDRVTIDRIEPEDIQAYIIYLPKTGKEQIPLPEMGNENINNIKTITHYDPQLGLPSGFNNE